MSNHGRYREHRIPSSLAKFAAPSSSDDSEMREKMRQAWRHFGIIVIWPDQSLPWDMRATVENAARRLYGDKVKRDG